jgi:imidazole glycerol phosphate synthase subunit HisF
VSFRICATVLVDSDGNAVQSYNFKSKRILGCINHVLKFLDRYEIDEIHVLFPLKKTNRIDPTIILNKLMNVPISTPLGIGGGINSKNLIKITREPYFERLIFNSSIFENDGLLKLASSIMGHQSMVASLPFIINNGEIKIYHSKTDSYKNISQNFWKSLSNTFNEIILIDSSSEGMRTGFNFKVFEFIKFPLDRVLISGGLKESDIVIAREMNLAGVSIDNSTLYTEFSVEGLR